MSRKGISAALLIHLLLNCSCTRTVYLPLEKVHTAYVDRFRYDSIYRSDTLRMQLKDDTVFITQIRYEYRNRTVRDSIFTTDTLLKPYPVEHTVSVKEEPGFLQRFLRASGLLAWILILVYTAFKYYLNRKKK